MNNLLKKNGELIGLFFPILKNVKEGGPPYSVNIDKVIDQFSDYFDVLKSIKHPLSIEPRVDNEQYLHFKKR